MAANREYLMRRIWRVRLAMTRKKPDSIAVFNLASRQPFRNRPGGPDGPAGSLGQLGPSMLLRPGDRSRSE